MKVLKIGVFAMALGFFAASCSNSGSTTTDETTAPATEQVEPTTDSATVPAVDSAVAPVTTDSTTAK